LTHGQFFKNKNEKDYEVTHDSHYHYVNYLNYVSKKITKLNKINENWDLIDQKDNIRTKMTNLNETKD